MAKEIEIDTAVLAGKVGNMAELTMSLFQDLDELKESLDALNNSWEGEAQRAFSFQFQQDFEAMKAVCETIEELQEAMSYASSQYTKCEQSIEDTVAEIKI